MGQQNNKAKKVNKRACSQDIKSNEFLFAPNRCQSTYVFCLAFCQDLFFVVFIFKLIICVYCLQVTAVHPVGEGQCIALGYESVLPLVLLTLQGGDMKPYEFPTEGTKAMVGSGMTYKTSFSLLERQFCKNLYNK